MTPGPAGQPPKGTEETDRRHHRQTDGRGTRPTDGMAWPQAPGPGLCLMQCAPALAPADTQSLGRGWPSASLSGLSLGAQQLHPRGGRGGGADSHMQLGAPQPKFSAARGQVPEPPWPSQAQHSLHPPCRRPGTAHGKPAPARHATLPLRLGGQPAMLLASGPSVPASLGQRDPVPSPPH